MEVSLVSFCRERQEGKVNRSQRLSLRCTAGKEEEGREREREREEDSVIEGERGQEGRSRARGREKKRERESGPAFTAHIAGWLAGSLTVDE